MFLKYYKIESLFLKSIIDRITGFICKETLRINNRDWAQSIKPIQI